MRFATWESEGVVAAGVVSDAGLHPFQNGVSVLDLARKGLPVALEAGEAALTSEPIRLETVRLLPPIQAPTVRDFTSFQEHVEGVRAGSDMGTGAPPEWYAAPPFYFSNPHALIGAYDDVAVPPDCDLFDFELEVAAVIGAVPGSDGWSVREEDAGDHIFGYTILNDWSARDTQITEMKVGLGPVKGKDSATTLGPWLVTPDELEAYRNDEGFLALDMRVSVNGKLIGQDLLSNMGWTFEQLVAQASRGAKIVPGDVLGSGTCGNGGCLLELWGRDGRDSIPPLHPGDVVEMTVEGIGTIRGAVVEGLGHTLPPVPAAHPRPVPRTRIRK
ncbi:fumarylacetoacetate hydrolase family protein [Mycolicibacterium sp. CBMA 226]|uniref:fumarylacetoacetate hydrolase family protein n=1 Tax=Mycolicibacterium sp. CBMA 226 TaxID=2606611 RepID=UPI0012DBF0DB|nr:fumarylacetoacetate hydrolase family protein [Mycolicibacterium sp. CBMA 226]MUL79005.1 fumarylacetoacetate hydrolase family protein [Mycolicibacterium sp. CBMA 226]QGW61321.1 Ureidoglycolate lyase [Mycolicibacterium sp.]